MPKTESAVRSTVLPAPSGGTRPVALEAGDPPAASPSPAPAGLSRSRILDATEACFAEAGYEGTTIRAIAGRLGCSVGSIYRYVPDKRRLLLACAERLLAPAAEAIEAGGTVEASAAVYAQQAARHGSLYRLMFWLSAADENAVPAPVERVLAGWADRLGDRGRAERRWAALHGAVLLGRAPQRLEPEPTAADAGPTEASPAEAASAEAASAESGPGESPGEPAAPADAEAEEEPAAGPGASEKREDLTLL